MMVDGNETIPAQEHHKERNSRVGYGNTPEETRFTPGKPGNAHGRPRGARGRKQIMREIAYEMHDVIENGKRCRRATYELVLLAIRNSAITGDVTALNECHEMLQRFEPQEIDEGSSGRVVLPQIMPEGEWNEMMERRRVEKAKGESAAGSNVAKDNT